MKLLNSGTKPLVPEIVPLIPSGDKMIVPFNLLSIKNFLRII